MNIINSLVQATLVCRRSLHVAAQHKKKVTYTYTVIDLGMYGIPWLQKHSHPNTQHTSHMDAKALTFAQFLQWQSTSLPVSSFNVTGWCLNTAGRYTDTK